MIAWILLSACTSLRGVTPGAAPGEFYTVASTWPVRRGFVVRCEVKPSGDDYVSTCARVLTADQVTELGPPFTEDVRRWKANGDGGGRAPPAPTVLEPVSTVGPSSTQEANWAATGRVSVVATVGAPAVSLDGVNLGGLPVNLVPATPGTHTLQWTEADGTVINRTVDVAAGWETRVTIDAAEGTIRTVKVKAP